MKLTLTLSIIGLSISIMSYFKWIRPVEIYLRRQGELLKFHSSEAIKSVDKWVNSKGFGCVTILFGFLLGIPLFILVGQLIPSGTYLIFFGIIIVSFLGNFCIQLMRLLIKHLLQTIAYLPVIVMKVLTFIFVTLNRPERGIIAVLSLIVSIICISLEIYVSN